MKYLDKWQVVVVATFAILISYAIIIQHTPEPSTQFQVDRSVKTTGRWIAFNPKQLEVQAGVRSTLRLFGNGQQLPGLNAYVFDQEPLLSRSLGNDGWVIQKEYVHHVFSAAAPATAKCYQSNGPLIEVTCPGTSPGPTPTPVPVPLPVPNPNPVESSKSWGRDRVHAPQALALVDTSAVKVCVVDTGIDLTHPNNGVLLATKDFSGKGSAQDGAGHGTHTAGTISGTGGVGISRAKLLICKGLSDAGSGTSAALAQCLTWCGQQGAQVVSNSWGSPQMDPMINAAINALTQRGTYVFVAAGNDSGPVNWPAKLAGSNALVYAIAASNQADQITSFSSRGPEVRFISPGQGIISNWPGGGTRALDGTSMATPHAAAICAFGLSSGKRPCIKNSGNVGGYPMADALESAR